MRAMRAAGDVRDPDAVRPWLLAITANRCRDELRSWARRNVSYVADVPEPDARSSGGSHDADPDLAHAILELAPPFREAILLHYYYGLSVAAIARVLELSPVTVRTRLHRGRGALRRALEKEALVHA